MGGLQQLQVPQSTDGASLSICSQHALPERLLVEPLLGDDGHVCPSRLHGPAVLLGDGDLREVAGMALTIGAEPVPLALDADGVARVGKTRGTLDTLVAALEERATAEEITHQ